MSLRLFLFLNLKTYSMHQNIPYFMGYAAHYGRVSIFFLVFSQNNISYDKSKNTSKFAQNETLDFH